MHSECHKLSYTVHTQPAAHLTHLFYILILLFRPLLTAASVVCSHHCSPWRESGAPWLSFRRPCTHRICSEQLFKRGQADGALGVSWGKYSAEVAPRRVWLKSVREEPVKELSFHGVWAWGDQQGLCPVTPCTGRAAAPGEHEAVLSAGL